MSSERPQSEIVDIVLNEVCEFHNMPIWEMQRKTRKNETVKVRQIAMHFLKKYTKLTLKQMGNLFGGLDHTTTMYSIKTVKDLKDTDPDYSHSLTQLETKIKYKLQ